MKDLWNDAVRAYNDIIGNDFKVLKRTFTKVDSIIAYGFGQMNEFRGWQHDEKRVDKLR